MSAIKETIDISRSPAEVFSYVTDPTHLPDWQENAVAARPLSDEPIAVGSKLSVTRHIGRRDMTMTMQVIDMDPPRSWHMHGIDGPVRGDVHGTIEPIDNGTRSRLTLAGDFEGHGIGKALVPLVVRPQVRKELPRNEQTLKGILEAGATA
ncbi:SRPBCC family protein [Streptomyces vilmorinianum]|uniref:SRPBCC family protein n=1 Tax=Streptomyces vilmorinianum TaxID=3051092 RepID=UPI0010FBBCB6|nr:SRPBCC family protein [Streptomyces vilmorinianum]